MDPIHPTTPFGRRPLSLAMVAAQAAAKACPDDAAAHKWRVFRNLTEAKEALALSDRALAVLAALLTFHPETALTPGQDLIVFPSNRELSLRAHSPAPATLRRALAQLVETGVVIRRDSPNGKRYARRGEGGDVAQAFGFDLTPLITRAGEFERLATELRAAARARLLLREEISLHRRDVAKTLAIASEEVLAGPWLELAERFHQFGPMPRRSASHAQLEALVTEMRALRLDVDKALASALNPSIQSANESQPERHYQSSNTDPARESEPSFRGSRVEPEAPPSNANRAPPRAYPLSMVLQACPDFGFYAKHGISSWRDLLSVATLVRASLGISPSAWAAAVEAMGEEESAITLAAILQRAEQIKSPGGYLRNLTEKAKTGQFSAWPMLMALWRVRPAEVRRA